MHLDAGSVFCIPWPVTAVPAADGADICRGRNEDRMQQRAEALYVRAGLVLNVSKEQLGLANATSHA